jgi:alpha-tubulin suppressor-like RCC1 family protein
MIQSLCTVRTAANAGCNSGSASPHEITSNIFSHNSPLPFGSEIRMTAPRPGTLFVWGRNSDGQCAAGPSTSAPGPPKTVALPHAVACLGSNVVAVACGTGQQGCTIAVLQDGSVWSFGNNSGGRLGLDGGGIASSSSTSSSAPSASALRMKQPALTPRPSSSATHRSTFIPRRIECLGHVHITLVSCSDAHALACSIDGSLFSWGKQSKSNCLGRPDVPPGSAALPAKINFFDSSTPVGMCDCESGYSAAVTRCGSLYTWGSNLFGRLGVGDVKDRCTPTEVSIGAGCKVVALSLGTLYAACVCCSEVDRAAQGRLLCWGYGGHGNLGLGDRRDRAAPEAVAGQKGSDFEREAGVVAIACTRGQEGVKGGLYPKDGGTEGPHTLCVAASGFMYSFGTCHKGLLSNLADKTGAFGQPWDELFPYRIGSPPRNACTAAPLSPYACWPPQRYAAELGRVNSVVSAHIHTACCGEDGRLWAWGCGSNDGRCGVERFLNMSGEGKPPRVDGMKCYMMGPHRVGCARAVYWPHGPSLDGVRVLAVASGRNHMACIGEAGGLPAVFVNRGLE